MCKPYPIANPRKRKNKNIPGAIKPMPHALGFCSIKPSTTATIPVTPARTIPIPPAVVEIKQVKKATAKNPKLP